MHTFRIKILVTGKFIKGLNNIAANFRSTRTSGYLESISTAGDLYIEAAFDLSQVFIKLSAKIGETAVVGGLQDDVPGYLYGVQGWVFGPLDQMNIKRWLQEYLEVQRGGIGKS